MAKFRITVKKKNSVNGVHIEVGMSVEVTSSTSNPVTTNGGKEVLEAFQRVYGIDLKKGGSLSTTYLEVEKIK